MIYSIDFETRSMIDLPDRGLDIYANDPSTEVLCMAYGTEPKNVVVYTPKHPAMGEVLAHVRNGGKVSGWNIAFEYAIWNCVCVPKYGWPPLKLEQCIDTMAMAAACNIPQSLDDAGAVMDSEYKKDPIGKKLIQKLCKPHKGEFNNDPELLKQLFDYCIRDVQTEMALGRTLRPLSAIEQEIWTLTMRINLRGVPVSPVEVENAVKAVQNAQKAIDEDCLALTGCKPSERAKLLKWLNEMGADMTDMTAETVNKMLQCNNLSYAIRTVLELRQMDLKPRLQSTPKSLTSSGRDEYEIRWSIMELPLVVGLAVVDSISKTLLALHYRTMRLQLQFRESLIRRVEPCLNSVPLSVQPYVRQTVKPSWMRIFLLSRTGLQRGSQDKTTK